MKRAILETITALGLAGMLSMSAWAGDNHTAGEVIDDTIITTKVKAALIADPVTKAYQISVDTFKGRVKLSGFVDTPDAELRALEIASNVEGVLGVDETLEVRQ